MMDEQELATVRAALHLYYIQGQGDPDARRDDIHAIATDEGNVISLDAKGIKDLYRRLGNV